MSSEWDELLQQETRRLNAAQRETAEQDAAAKAKAADLDTRFDAVAAEYERIATSFDARVRAHGLTWAETYTFYRSKEPLFRSRLVRVPLVLVPDVGRWWYRVGETGSGGTHSHSQALAIGHEIRPTIMSPFPPTEQIPYGVYERARKSSELVHGLAEMLANARRHGQTPEFLLARLKKGLARWAAANWPELDLAL